MAAEQTHHQLMVPGSSMVILDPIDTEMMLEEGNWELTGAPISSGWLSAVKDAAHRCKCHWKSRMPISMQFSIIIDCGLMFFVATAIKYHQIRKCWTWSLVALDENWKHWRLLLSKVGTSSIHRVQVFLYIINRWPPAVPGVQWRWKTEHPAKAVLIHSWKTTTSWRTKGPVRDDLSHTQHKNDN